MYVEWLVSGQGGQVFICILLCNAFLASLFYKLFMFTYKKKWML